MDSTAPLSTVSQPSTADPARQAFLLLRTVFTVAPIVFGLDKFANVLTDWPAYLAPWIDDIVPGTAQQAMYAVGVVEIVAGVVVAVVPRFGGWLVAAWLVGIIVNLLTIPGFYDIALRDFGLLVGAVALARLAAVYAPAAQHPDAGVSAPRPARCRRSRPVPLRVVRERGAVDVPAAERAVAGAAAGAGPGPASSRTWPRPRAGSPTRSPRCSPGRTFDLTTFPNDEGYNELVLATRASRSGRCASTTCCRSPGWRTSATCPATGSSGCPSSPACSTCSPATCRCRSG